MQPDGTFTASVRTPARGSRVRAAIGGRTSSALALSRTYATTTTGRRVTLRGPRGAAVTIARQDTCTKRTTVKTLRLPASGRQTLTLAAATSTTSYAVTFRTGSGRRAKTTTLPVVVRATGR